jgi:hypothetical protein
MTFRNKNQDISETFPKNYNEYPMMNYCPAAYRYSMLPCQNIHYETMPRYMEYDNDSMTRRNDDVNDYKGGFRQYHNRPYYPYYPYPAYNPYPPYNYPPYYNNYYSRPYYNSYYDYDYGIPFLTGLVLGSFF